MACGRFGFLVRLIDLMAVVQNGTGKSNLPHACALADGDVVAKWKKQSLFLLIYCFWMNIGLNSLYFSKWDSSTRMKADPILA